MPQPIKETANRMCNRFHSISDLSFESASFLAKGAQSAIYRCEYNNQTIDSSRQALPKLTALKIFFDHTVEMLNLTESEQFDIQLTNQNVRYPVYAYMTEGEYTGKFEEFLSGKMDFEEIPEPFRPEGKVQEYQQ